MVSDTGPRQRRRSLNEAAQTTDLLAPVETNGDVRSGRRPAEKRSFNQSAHKLGDQASPASGHARAAESEAIRSRFAALDDSGRDVIAHAGKAVLALGALGVVYGDIGTSPLYTEQVIFGSYRATAHITPALVYGVASLIFWALTVVVSIKYAGFIMRAHNRGDGGIMALTALLQRSRVAQGAVLVTLGIFGAALFFGDGIITPAISVLGSIQGVKVATPALAHLVVPLSVAILIGLFILQRFGSRTIGWIFSLLLDLVWPDRRARPERGAKGSSRAPGAVAQLGGAVHDRPRSGRLPGARRGRARGNGRGGPYADRGHFGAGAIRLGWFGLAFPALMLNYLGQAVFILHNPSLAKDATPLTPSTRWHRAGRCGRW